MDLTTPSFVLIFLSPWEGWYLPPLKSAPRSAFHWQVPWLPKILPPDGNRESAFAPSIGLDIAFVFFFTFHTMSQDPGAISSSTTRPIKDPSYAHLARMLLSSTTWAFSKPLLASRRNRTTLARAGTRYERRCVFVPVLRAPSNPGSSPSWTRGLVLLWFARPAIALSEEDTRAGLHPMHSSSGRQHVHHLHERPQFQARQGC